jgi:thiamine biosynthesis lipoprotein
MALRRVEPVMGTVVSFDLRDDVVPMNAVDDAVAWLHEVDERFSPFRPDSEVSRLAEGSLAEVDAHPDLRAVLALCDELRRDSDGAFDARTWTGDGRLDPSGLVKGWAVQLAADRLFTAGLRAFAITAGGDIVARGAPPPGGAWRVGIRHPDRPDRLAGVITIEDAAVATSGDYERGAHIRDPHSGASRAGLRSVTVVGPSLTWADAYATTAFIKGIDGLAWVARHDGYAAYGITDDDRVLWTEGFDRYLASA